MEEILTGIPGMLVYLDDVLVMGKKEEEHLRNMEQLLQKIKEPRLKLKRGKCEFFQDSSIYLGHDITALGPQPSKKNADAFTQDLEPNTVTEQVVETRHSMNV